ncbi:MAG TPA: helix-hairpin-helix domain-containing protein [Candidatus Thermoplasmatota archaeon]|nr:helix-hairpin-helix domain-containing protein [Candidatus Thermoplasmatota archaeon]
MAKQKKPIVDDIEKLRRILDNPSDPNATKMLTTYDTSLDSVRRRLTQKTPVFRSMPSITPSRVSSSLQPTVMIRPRVKPTISISPPVSKSPISLPEFEPVASQQSPASTTEPLPEFTPVSSPETIEMPPLPEELSFDDEDLIEIEKVDITYPEFSVAHATEEPGMRESITTPETLKDQDLPLWKPVTETSVHDFTITEKPPSTEEIPEFTPSESEPTHERISEAPSTWAPPIASEVLPQTRSQKKAERLRQKEEKRQRKLEQKVARKEVKQREKEAKRQKKLEAEQTQRVTPEESEEPQVAPMETPPTPEEPMEEPVDQPVIKPDISAFKEIESIDDHVGELLYRNGYFSLEDLRKATVDDLVHIRGIKRKLAKKIKKEVEQKAVTTPDEEFVSFSKKPKSKKPKGQPKDVTEWESFSVNNHEDTRPATYGRYTLYERERGRGSHKTTVHFFSKEKSVDGTPIPLPSGYEIAVRKNTKVPYLKKKK